MRIRVKANDYSPTAMLVAIKKQQVSAVWRIEDQNEESVVLAFDKAESQLSDEECEKRLRQQLDDEVLREKLELDFGRVRDLLVEVALKNLVDKKEK